MQIKKVFTWITALHCKAVIYVNTFLKSMSDTEKSYMLKKLMTVLLRNVLGGGDVD